MAISDQETIDFWLITIGIPQRTLTYLGLNEDLSTIDQLIDFQDDEIWKMLTDNMRHPPMIPALNAGVPDVVPLVPAGTLVKQAPLVMSAKSLTRVRMAARLVKYYALITRELTADLMIWDRIKSFDDQIKSIKEMIKDTTLEP